MKQKNLPWINFYEEKEGTSINLGRNRKDRINHFSQYLNNKVKVLDIGCGIGNKTNYINQLGFETYGIDISQKAINTAKKNYKEINFCVSDIINNCFQKESFDGIFTMAILHCFKRQEGQKIISEIEKLLVPGGYLFGTTLSHNDKFHKRGRPIGKNTYQKEDGMILHFFNKNEMEKDFEKFDIIELKEQTNKNNNISSFNYVVRKKH